VVDVVEANSDEIARASNRGTDARSGRDLRQARRVDGAQLVERCRRQVYSGEIFDVGGEVAAVALAID